MKLDLYLKKTDNLFAENRLLKFVIVLMTVAVCFSFYSMNRVLTHQQTIIIPPNFDQRLEIKGNNVNDEYLKMYTRYILDLLLNYTPKNIKYNFNDLLSFSTPELYPELQKNLLKIEDNVDKLRVSSMFYPSQITIDREKKIITIGGVRRQFANFSKIDETQRNYYLRYQIDNGRFYIANIQEQEIADENENENPIH